jgi:hypothetical protein
MMSVHENLEDLATPAPRRIEHVAATLAGHFHFTLDRAIGRGIQR